jgi:hypothetical protein
LCVIILHRIADHAAVEVNGATSRVEVVHGEVMVATKGHGTNQDHGVAVAAAAAIRAGETNRTGVVSKDGELATRSV